MVKVIDIFDMIDAANVNELDLIINAATRRREAISSVNIKSARVGMQVTFRDLSPKYLNGLVGTIVTINSTGTRGAVKLDVASTNKLARTKQSRFYVESGTPYTMEGVPFKACDFSDEA
jgi:hypothetical protein